MKQPMVRKRHFDRLAQAIIAGTAVTLLLTGCGDDTAQSPTSTETAESAESGGNAGSAEVQASEEASAEEQTAEAPSAHAFTGAFEAEGLTCAEVEDPFGDTVIQQFNCEGDDHLIMTIRNYGDVADRDDQLATIQSKACEIADQGQKVQRVATSDTWILMAGGDRHIDFEVFEGAMTTLGLDSTDYTCEA